MGWPELKAKYGRTGRAGINRAIRAEIVGGDDCLDSLETTLRLAQRMEERKLAGAQLARDAHELLKELRQVMSDIVCKRYEISE